MKSALNTSNTSENRRPSVAEARAVVREFLAGALLDVERVDIVEVSPVLSGNAAWEVEADVWQPNSTLKSLGVEPGRPVWDHNHYLVRLDASLNVLEYGPRDSF